VVLSLGTRCPPLCSSCHLAVIQEVYPTQLLLALGSVDGEMITGPSVGVFCPTAFSFTHKPFASSLSLALVHCEGGIPAHYPTFSVSLGICLLTLSVDPFLFFYIILPALSSILTSSSSFLLLLLFIAYDSDGIRPAYQIPSFFKTLQAITAERCAYNRFLHCCLQAPAHDIVRSTFSGLGILLPSSPLNRILLPIRCLPRRTPPS